MKNIPFQAFWVTEGPEGVFRSQIVKRSIKVLPQNGVLVKVLYSSLNYKDALSATGNKGITKQYPFTPGIDAAGIVTVSNSKQFKEGDVVVVTGYDLGMNTMGGFAEYINVPAEWLVPLPSGLSAKECMTLGTAGFTAALMLHHLLRCGQLPDDGPLLVTGATGGVGSLSVAMASKLGFHVVASTGKKAKETYLINIGAKEVLQRSEVDDQSDRMLLRARWAAAMDTVGGNTLATILKSLKVHGNVACCGNVASPLLHTSVYPFILNGVNLLGVNTATTPMPLRLNIWDKMANDWKPDFDLIETKTVNLQGLKAEIGNILKGEVTGRVVVEMNH